MVLCPFFGKSCNDPLPFLQEIISDVVNNCSLPLQILFCRTIAMGCNGRYNLKCSCPLSNLLNNEIKGHRMSLLLSGAVLGLFSHVPPWRIQYTVLDSKRDQVILSVKEKKPPKVLFDTKLIHNLVSLQCSFRHTNVYLYHQLCKTINETIWSI